MTLNICHISQRLGVLQCFCPILYDLPQWVSYPKHVVLAKGFGHSFWLDLLCVTAQKHGKTKNEDEK